jgi:hypothetical protein
VDHGAILAEGSKIDIFLILNLGWDGRSHIRILIAMMVYKLNGEISQQIAPDTLPVLQALHAQMDE